MIRFAVFAGIAEKSRLLNEGEAESKNPIFSNKALAKWADSEQKLLVCPHCETTESIAK